MSSWPAGDCHERQFGRSAARYRSKRIAARAIAGKLVSSSQPRVPPSSPRSCHPRSSQPVRDHRFCRRLSGRAFLPTRPTSLPAPSSKPPRHGVSRLLTRRFVGRGFERSVARRPLSSSMDLVEAFKHTRRYFTNLSYLGRKYRRIGHIGRCTNGSGVAGAKQ